VLDFASLTYPSSFCDSRTNSNISREVLVKEDLVLLPEVLKVNNNTQTKETVLRTTKTVDLPSITNSSLLSSSSNSNTTPSSSNDSPLSLPTEEEEEDLRTDQQEESVNSFSFFRLIETTKVEVPTSNSSSNSTVNSSSRCTVLELLASRTEEEEEDPIGRARPRTETPTRRRCKPLESRDLVRRGLRVWHPSRTREVIHRRRLPKVW